MEDMNTMEEQVCIRCNHISNKLQEGLCKSCRESQSWKSSFQNSDEYLREKVPLIIMERRKAGLEGLAGGIDHIIINTEPAHFRDTVEELLSYTGLEFYEAFEDSEFTTCVLKAEGSADFLVRFRKNGPNPFNLLNRYPKSAHLAATRLESFVFATTDIEKYMTIQKERGVEFLTDNALRGESFSFIQTKPSVYTGNSMGFIEWSGRKGSYRGEDSERLSWKPEKPRLSHLSSIRELDHIATRVRAEDRDNAVMEFMYLTGYHFDFAIYVQSLNSITNVARHPESPFALVFTSGISSFIDEESSGPTEKFIHNYGPRAHHMAFRTEKMENTCDALRSDGMGFLIDLTGSPEEGLKQIFSEPSRHTFLVNEYICRYGDFDGFFTRSNVTALTAATLRQ